MTTTKKPIKLKRCPFCGGKARIKPLLVSNGLQDKILACIGCVECKIDITASRFVDAVRRWNTRSSNETEDTFVEVDGVWIERVKKDNDDKTETTDSKEE